MRNKETHCVKIRRHLLDGHSITAIDALNFYDCMNLKGRIFELRVEPYNMPIQKIMIKLKNGKRVARYYLLKSYIDRLKEQLQTQQQHEPEATQPAA